MTTFKFNPAIMVWLSILVILTISNTSSAANPSKDIYFKFYFIAKTDGSIQKLLPPNHVPASLDEATNVQSTDVVINQKTKVVGRLYRPMKADPGTRVPILVYFHQGGFSISSALDKDIHSYMNKLSSVGKVAILSVDYRLTPENPITAAYNDGYDAVNWLSENCKSGEIEWMKQGVDFDRIYLGGHDSGGNIAHNVGMWFQNSNLKGVKLAGIITIQSYFLTVEPLPSLLSQDNDMKNNITQLWPFLVPGSGPEDTRVNPSLETKLNVLKPAKVLVCTAELDGLRDASKAYHDALVKNGVKSEYYVSLGKLHNFDMFAPNSAEATVLQTKIVSFMNAQN